MATTHTLTCRLECDEQAMVILDANDGTLVAEVPWPPDVYTARLEPDYQWLTETMALTTTNALNDLKGMRPENPVKLTEAIGVAVTPGPGDDYRLFNLLYTTTDTASVKVKQDPTYGRFVDREITVQLLDPYDQPASRATGLPTIGLIEPGRYQLLLTWEEAKALAKALLDVTSVAENG